MSLLTLQECGGITVRLLAALTAGTLVGLERSHHGRSAGLRTHALVCLSTALLMLLTAYESHWFQPPADVRPTLDPTRMAQGIMTGVGFLGAGAIMKAGYSIRGLTTAASIWITAAIGILTGAGLYFPAALACVLTLGVLSGFRWIEARVPTLFYADFIIRFARGAAMSEAEMRALVRTHGFTIANLNYRLNASDDYFEYRMIVRSLQPANARRFSEALQGLSVVKEFRLSPTVD